MEEDFPGPYCMEIQLSKKKLNDLSTIKPYQFVNNGVLLELNAHFKSVNKVIDVLFTLQPELSSANKNSLRSKINRLIETKKKLVSRKKVKGISTISELNSQPFGTPGKNVLYVTPCKNSGIENKEDSLQLDSNLVSARRSLTLCDPESVENVHIIQNTSPIKSQNLNKDENKELNLFEYELSKKKKTLERVNKEIELLREKLESQENRIGHFAVRNVNKRDETARKNLHLLRETERQLHRQKRVESNHLEIIENLTKENSSLKLKENQTNQQNNVTIEQKKLKAQKNASYYKVRAKKLNEKLKSNVLENELVKSLKLKNAENEEKIRDLEVNLDILTEQLSQNSCETKNSDGTFSDNLRICIIELGGLEVAVEKVPSVLKSVSRHLFGVEFKKSDLPSSTTVQTIIDEGHYLAKTFISEQLYAADNWGLNRDGTTRKKQKIVDTTVTLDSGNVLSLGFNRVAHETADTINEVTKKHINELATLNAEVSEVDADTFMKKSLERLAFTMSDRASNEKKADRLLDEWRDELLKDTNDTKQVMHFHCMAHVLLGFHRYISLDLKDYESTLSEEYGPLGRDAEPVFKYWKTRTTKAERVLLTVSEVFGPSGDHHGVRDLWEAHCASNGIKSIIGNYKDNRFNALFQTAAEIYLHRSDFLYVLESMKTPNLKLKSVIADLKCNILMTIIQCFGLFYLKLTGPYWNLLIGNKVPYVQLHTEINEIKKFLETCEKEPAHIMNYTNHWSDDDPHEIRNVAYKQLLSDKLWAIIECEGIPCRDILLKTVNLVAVSMVKTIDKQLVDFLPGGKFGTEPSTVDLKRTAFAHVTNLACEHHFGDLDSSQRRRPSASMHHHSSIQLLKRNRLKLINWFDDMSGKTLQKVMKQARKGGKALRIKHREQEKSVLREINMDLMKMKISKQKGKKRRVDCHGNKSTKKHKTHEEVIEETDFEIEEEQELKKKLPTQEQINENAYVAVAYQDGWYPGIVMKTNTDKTFVVKFMSVTRKSGHFCWPSREDLQTVEKDFILKMGFVPNCINSGRMWEIVESSEIEKLFLQFKKFYF